MQSLAQGVILYRKGDHTQTAFVFPAKRVCSQDLGRVIEILAFAAIFDEPAVVCQSTEACIRRGADEAAGT